MYKTLHSVAIIIIYLLSVAVTVSFGRPNVTVNESDGFFRMCVVKDRETIVPVTVDIISRAGSATEGSGEEIMGIFCSSCQRKEKREP